MDAPPSPNHVFNFLEDEEFEEDRQEEPEEELEEELEVDVEEDAPPAATLPVGSPITPPPFSESLLDSEAVAPVVANRAHEMPPAISTFEVGGPSSVSSFPLFYFHGRELERLNDNTKILFRNVNYLERCEKKRQAKVDENSFGIPADVAATCARGTQSADVALPRSCGGSLEVQYETSIPLVGVGAPEGSNDYTKVTLDKEQCLCNHYTAHVTPPAYIPSLPFLATMEPTDTLLMGDEVISTTPARENNEFIKSSIDDLVPILRESEVTSDSNFECDMPINTSCPQLMLEKKILISIRL
ncbi:hypothetical protein Tco_1216539 [Tanacetum coccineum]